MNETGYRIRNAVESITLYAQSQPDGIIENGKISNPERLGRLTPQIRNSRNKAEREVVFKPTLTSSSAIRGALSSICEELRFTEKADYQR